MANTNQKHILMISQYFYPEQFRINDICTKWVQKGYKVTVLTGIPNYPKGKFFEGYGYRKKRREQWNGIDIIRIPLIPRGHSAVGMVANYFSFVVSGFFWKLFTKVKADVVFSFEVSPMTQVKVGVWYAKKHKVPHFLYVQDLWPENIEIITGIHSPLVLGPIGRMVDKIYAGSDHIFATSPSFVTAIQKRCDDKQKVTYWPQYAEQLYCPVERQEAYRAVPELADDGTCKVVFTGNIGKAQGLDVLPEVAKRLGDKPVRFVIVGDGREEDALKKHIADNGVEDKFLFLGRQAPERIAAILGCCDVAFLSFMDNPLFSMTIPAKLQSYMACGMPIVAAAMGEARRVIEEAACGTCCDIGDVTALTAAITAMMAMPPADRNKMKQNAVTYCREHFDSERLLAELDGYFNEV